MFLVLVLACVGPEGALAPVERPGPPSKDDDEGGAGAVIGDAPEDTSTEDPAALWESPELPRFSLTFEEEDWEDALAALIRTGNCDERPYLRGDLVFHNPLSGREERWNDVAVRYRGRSALTVPNYGSDNRWGIKIDFEEHVEDRRFHGAERINLLGTEGDYSLLRERVALERMREAGLPAPRASHALLEVNGEPLGVFPLVEEADDRAFLDAHFGEDQGHLYKVAGYCHGTDLDYNGEDVDDYEGFEAKGVTTDEDKSGDLVPMFACLETGDSGDTFRTCLEQWVDVDAWLSEIALDMLLTNVDGMSATGQNFMLYRPPDGRFVFYPYDLDLTFYNPHAATLLSSSIFDLRPTWEPRLPVLPRKIREAYAPQFCDRVLLFANDPGADGFAARIEDIASEIEDAVEEDPFLSHSKWQDEVERLVDRMRDRHEEVVAEAADCEIPPEPVETPRDETGP
ncbi:MAG: CotH kinase family protein [Myxococcota bacterium]